MFDDPTKWHGYRIVVPSKILILVREGTEWYFTTYEGGKIPIADKDFATVMAAVFASTHEEEDWIYRHSFRFRWLRFWYRRKKARQKKIDSKMSM